MPIKIASSGLPRKYKASEYNKDRRAATKSILSELVKFFNISISLVLKR